MHTIKVTICVIAVDTLPQFFCDDNKLRMLAQAGHDVLALCPIGTGDMIRSWRREFSNVSVREFPDTESGLIRTLNEALEDDFDWHENDLIIVNNADYELTEERIEDIKAGIYAFDRYTLGNPRSNIVGWTHLDADDVAFAQTNLPAVTLTPYPIASCVYVKSRYLALLGPLDDSFHSLDAALCDFALRANRYGFDSIMLNHVFIPLRTQSCHASSFDAMDSRDSQELLSRHSYIHDVVKRFKYSGIDPVDRFLGEIKREKRKPRVLLDYSNIPPIHCGTSEYQIALLRCLSERYSDKYDIHVFAKDTGAAFHRLDRFSRNIYLNESELGTYDIGVYAAQPTQISRQAVADRHCARMVYTMLDSILLRCAYMNFSHADSVDAVESVRCGLANCDGIIAISDYSKNDVLNYFQNDKDILSKPIRSIHIASDFGDFLVKDDSVSLEGIVPFDEYVLLAGNPWFDHKALRDAIEVLRPTNRNYVVVGYGSDDFIYPNVFGCSYGYISEEVLFEMYRKCSAFVFPSVYEGFGLPIINALKCGKAVVAFNYPLNVELIDHLGIKDDNVILFDTFEEIPAALEKALDSNAQPIEYSDTWEHFTNEFCRFIDEILARPLDLEQLRSRHRTYSLYQQKYERTLLEIDGAKYKTPAGLLLKERIYRNQIEEHPNRLALWHAVQSALQHGSTEDGNE